MNIGNHISSPAPGSVVIHSGWRPAGRSAQMKGYPRLVYIVSGNYEVNGRISNWWTWRPILSNGTLGKEVHGYGSFYESLDVYTIKITVIKK